MDSSSYILWPEGRDFFTGRRDKTTYVGTWAKSAGGAYAREAYLWGESEFAGVERRTVTVEWTTGVPRP